GEFEPRVTRLRQRRARLEEQRQALADEAAVQGALQLILGRLEDFAAKVHDGLEATDWASKRDLIRALVKRVEVARDDVNMVFRIDPYQGDPDLEKKVCNFVGRVTMPPWGVPARLSLWAPRRSRYPARRSFQMRLIKRSSLIFLRSRLTRVPCSISSKDSPTQYPYRQLT